jgi:hypothetical protein
MIEGISGVVGTFSWLDPEEDSDSIHSAALRTPTPTPMPAGPRLDIEVGIHCALCRGLMISPQKSVEWESEAKARVVVDVYPVCPKCVHEVEGSPEFWINKIRELRRPDLKLIPGGAENPDAPSRDHLRLVEEPPEESE